MCLHLIIIQIKRNQNQLSCSDARGYKQNSLQTTGKCTYGTWGKTWSALFYIIWSSHLSVCILILVVLWYKATNFRGIAGHCRLATPTDFIRGISAGKLDSFQLDIVSVGDKCESINNDYFYKFNISLGQSMSSWNQNTQHLLFVSSI